MSLVKIILVMPATNASFQCALSDIEKGEVLSLYNHVEHPPQSSFNMHSLYGARNGTKPLASHQ